MNRNTNISRNKSCFQNNEAARVPKTERPQKYISHFNSHICQVLSIKSDFIFQFWARMVEFSQATYKIKFSLIK